MDPEPRTGERQPITVLLARWSAGDGAALDHLVSIAYAELRRLASRSMRRERPDHTLGTTALVHEAYLRLARGIPPDLEDRGHFFTLIARLMRRILVDHARGSRTRRRGGGERPLPLATEPPAADRSLDDLLALDEALEALRRVDERKAIVIELRFFGGLDVSETAAALRVSVPTVVNDTRMARAWIYDRVHGPRDP